MKNRTIDASEFIIPFFVFALNVLAAFLAFNTTWWIFWACLFVSLSIGMLLRMSNTYGALGKAILLGGLAVGLLAFGVLAVVFAYK